MSLTTNDAIYSGVLAIATPLVCYHNNIIKFKFSPSHARILPEQFALRLVQIKMAQLIKQQTDCSWLGFAAIGVMQGVCYGHATSRLAGLPLAFSGRGLTFGAGRDIISQGVPYNISSNTYQTVGYTFLCTGLSHFLHNLQLLMQTKNISHRKAIEIGFYELGPKLFYKGVSGRINLLLITNLLNYKFKII